MTRREFLAASTALLGGAGFGCHTLPPEAEPIIDIHQHVNYGGRRDANWRPIGSGRSDATLLQHQHNMGVTHTILLPAGSPVIRPSTHQGFSNGLEGTCSANESCAQLAKQHRAQFYFGSNEVPDLEEAPRVIENFLQLGAVVIAEQKFGVECDSPQMQTLYQLAAEYRVPILMHWQYGTYNYGYDRFHRMLERYPKTIFIGHAQTVWAHIDGNYRDDLKNLYPSGKIHPGGLTVSYLENYPNFIGDLSAGSGHNALTRDPEFTQRFLHRHQNQLVFGSDCSDHIGAGPACIGWTTIRAIRELAPNKTVERKLLYHNAARIFRLDLQRAD